MPIPQESDQPTKSSAADYRPTYKVEMWGQSDENIRTQESDDEILEIPIDGSPRSPEGHVKDAEPEIICTDRAELIERIKRGESPTWVPNKALKQEYIKANNGEFPPNARKPIEPLPVSPLLPSVELKNATHDRPVSPKTLPPDFTEIERPRSALHAGDFTANHVDRGDKNSTLEQAHGLEPFSDTGPLGKITSPTTPWYTPPSSFYSTSPNPPFNAHATIHNVSNRTFLRSRAPSLNAYHSSSYVLKAPTTPLIQQLNNTDLDFSPRDHSISPEKSNRRRTLPPHAFNNIHSGSHWTASSQPLRHSPSYRREASFPYSHQPRRSLTSNWSLQASSSPQTPPYLRSRRTSFNSEASPLQHASMVGSYEESILRGWMSTAPSKPLDFTAQIGVLGRGSCKPKCPPHVTVPFPAVYYNWSTGNGRSSINDDPSPYVGHIDMQQSQSLTEMMDPLNANHQTDNEPIVKGNESMHSTSATNYEPRNPKRRRRTSPLKAPVGGYRIPQQGQLQIIIKNPNKTAVKLFLVPYDLEGMEPGTKTFVRQRSYSADPVIDGPLPQKPSDSASPSKKSTLRYLIHLNICSPSKGRFYLYHQIRVVFANRVPDNKEQLRNEIQVPQPRFNTYKPEKESLRELSSSMRGNVASENACRRRSSGFSFGAGDSPIAHNLVGGSTFPSTGGPVPPIPDIPLVSRRKPTSPDRVNSPDTMEIDKSRPTTSDDAQSPLSDKSNRLTGMQLSSSYKSNSSQGSDGYSKLNRGDSGYGGLPGRPGTPEPGEGLLARKLRGLGVQREAKRVEDES